MEVDEYINEKIKLQNLFMDYVDNELDENENYDSLIDYFTTSKIAENKEEIRCLFHFLNIISNNHHRSPNFFQKIEKIISYFEKSFKDSFSNIEIIDLFWCNKRILLYLYESHIIIFDPIDMYQRWLNSNIKNIHKFVYFYPEIKLCIDDPIMLGKIEEFLPHESNFDDFDKKRKIGENDSYICLLIRNDMVVEFISYVNRANIQVSSMKIKPSIFETNSVLLKFEETTLIEYAAFFGSIQIFQYLRMSNVELTPSLWIYAIHSRNAELIHLLEEIHVSNTFQTCFEESLKCHHNEIADYILDNNWNDANLKKNYLEDKFAIECCLYSYNYSYFDNFIDDESFFFYLCKYDYVYLCKLFMKTKNEECKQIIVLI